jgi:hypothetical protein
MKKQMHHLSSVFPNVVSKKYWSSTSQFNHGTNAWFIDFQNFGLTSYISKTTRGCYIMCVRTATPKTSGINSLVDYESGLKLYPNPVNSVISIQLSGVSIKAVEVMDLQDRKIDLPIYFLNTDYCKLNTENLSSGIYFVRTTDIKGFSSIAKFVKQ